MSVAVTCFGGAGEIGGNKILVEDGDKRLMIDFGMSFGRTGEYFDGVFLAKRAGRGLLDPLALELLPSLRGLLRDDLVPVVGGCDEEMFWRYWQERFPGTYRDLRRDGLAVDAILVSHAHLDHIADIEYVAAEIPLVGTCATAFISKILQDVGGGSGAAYLQPAIANGSGVLHTDRGAPSQRRPWQFLDYLPAGGTADDPLATAQSFWDAPGSKGREMELAACSAFDGRVGPWRVRWWPVDHSISGGAALPVDAWVAAKRLDDLLTLHGLSLHDAYRHYTEDVIPFLCAPTVAGIADELLTEVEATGCRPDTLRTLRAFFAEFKRGFGDRKLTDIRKRELAEFCLRSDLKPKTRHNRRAMASQLYNFAIENDWAKKNIASRLPAPRQEDKEPEILTVDQAARLLVAADKHGILGYVILGLFAGIRPQELKRLDWADVHVNDKLIVIYGAASKIHCRRQVSIHRTLAAWLKLCRQKRGPIVEMRDFSSRFTIATKDAGIERWPHDVLRHTFATYHAAAFKNLEETARQMGHIGGLRILKRHYVAFGTQVEAKRFWALLPEAVLGEGKA